MPPSLDEEAMLLDTRAQRACLAAIAALQSGMENENDKVLDPVAEFILESLGEWGSAAPVDIARALGEIRKKASDKPDAWRKFMTPVKQQMLHLARAGLIEITRKGKVVDPEDFRGVIRMRLAGKELE